MFEFYENFLSIGSFLSAIKVSESISFLDQSGSGDKKLKDVSFFIKHFNNYFRLNLQSSPLEICPIPFDKTISILAQPDSVIDLETYGPIYRSELQNLVVHWLKLFVMLFENRQTDLDRITIEIINAPGPFGETIHNPDNTVDIKFYENSLLSNHWFTHVFLHELARALLPGNEGHTDKWYNTISCLVAVAKGLYPSKCETYTVGEFCSLNHRHYLSMN